MLLPLLSIDARLLDCSRLGTELLVSVFECILWARIGVLFGAGFWFLIYKEIALAGFG